MDPYQKEDDNNNTRLQTYLKDQFQMLLQEANNFQKTTLSAVKHSTDTVETDLVQRFSNNAQSSNELNVSEHTLHEYNRLLQDYKELEASMIPWQQKDAMYVHDSINLDIPGTSQNPEPAMEKNDAENVVTCGLNDSIGLARTADFVGGGEVTMSAATYINSSGNGIRSQGDMFTSLVKFANVSSCGLTTNSMSRIAAWRQGGAKATPKPRHKRRRRYRGVYQTEEEAILKQELLKIKQRATSAEAYQKKKDYINRLEEQVVRLRELNKRQRTSLMFLGSNSFTDIPLKPLKRTFSGPL